MIPILRTLCVGMTGRTTLKAGYGPGASTIRTAFARMMSKATTTVTEQIRTIAYDGYSNHNGQRFNGPYQYELQHALTCVMIRAAT